VLQLSLLARELLFALVQLFPEPLGLTAELLVLFGVPPLDGLEERVVRLLPLLTLVRVALVEVVHGEFELVVGVHEVHAELLLEVVEVLDLAFVDYAFALEARVEFDLFCVASLDSGSELVGRFLVDGLRFGTLAFEHVLLFREVLEFASEVAVPGVHILLQALDFVLQMLDFAFRLETEFLEVGLGLVSLGLRLLVRVFEIREVFVENVILLAEDAAVFRVLRSHEILFLAHLELVLRGGHLSELGLGVLSLLIEDREFSVVLGFGDLQLSRLALELRLQVLQMFSELL